MPVLRGPQGQTVTASDAELDYYVGRGYTPLDTEAESAGIAAAAAAPVDRGLLGTANAAASGFLSGLTLGGSDVITGALSTQNDLDQLRADKAVNPVASTVANIGGGLVAGLAAPGSALARTPAGYLSGLSTAGVEAVRAGATGVRALAGQAAVMGGEAAAQNVGSYLGSVALGDRKLTAEGLAGAAGSGFALGGAGGAAVYGLEKGTIAARKLFAHVMEGGADAERAAAGALERRVSEVGEANADNIAEARRRVEEAQRALDDAQLGQARARAYTADELVLARRGAAEPPPEALPGDVPGFGLADDAPALGGESAAPALPLPDPVASMEARIRAGEVAGESGPFSPDGLRAAAQRELARQEQRAAVGGFDFSPRTGSALGEARKGGNLARPAPLGDTSTAAPTDAADDIVRVETAQIGGPREGRFEVRRYRGSSAEPFEVTELNTRQTYGQQLDDFMDSQVPTGFTGATLDARKPFAVRRGLPAIDEIQPNTLHVVRPSELAEHGVFGNTLKPANRDSVLKAWDDGVKLRPVDADMTPDGRLWIEDGNHRLQAAARTDRPVAMNIRRRGEGWEPQSNAHDISGRIREELPAGSSGGARRIGLPPAVAATAAKATEAEEAGSELMRLLQGTKAQIDEGASIQQIGIAARAQPLSPKQLTSSIDRLTEEAAGAVDVETRQALLRQVGAIEDQLAMAPKSKAAIDEIQAVAAAMTRHEKAVAALAEDLGDAAHPITRDVAAAMRKAEGDVESQMLDRAAQHLDGQADAAAGRLSEEAAKEAAKQGGSPLSDAPAPATAAETFGAARLSPRERVTYARSLQDEANAATARAKVGLGEARQGLRSAQDVGADVGRAADLMGFPGGGGPGVGAAVRGAAGEGASRALDIGAALEAASSLGIPGLPKPGDLPVIGPILGLYLKARALKAGADRLMGRVPATGNARVAALASATKDKAARSVDRMLGATERAAATQRGRATATAAARVASIVKDRIFDDGTKAPAASAPITEHVAARSREIAALAQDPGRLAAQVRHQLRDVSDPEMVAAAIEFRTRQIGYLDKVAPKEPPPGAFPRPRWAPSKPVAMDFARKYAVAMDPVVALEQVEQRCITPAAAEAFREVYPLLYRQTQERLISRAPQLRVAPDRDMRTRMSVLFQIPLDPGLEPENLTMLQAAHGSGADQPPAPGPAGGAPLTPSIAGPTDLAAMYDSGSPRSRRS